MECEQVKPALMDYLLEEATGNQAIGIQQHLEQCAACSQEAGRFRQTLALLRQAQRMEEIPQRIRLASEPARRWQAFWLRPARLAFAASALACLAIALLALSRATVSIGGGGLRIAFAPSPAMPAISLAGNASLQNAVAPGMSRAEVLQLVSNAVSASEARQQEDEKRVLKGVSQQNEQQRMRDWNEITEGLRPLEAAQVTIWKQQMQSDQYVSELMQQAGMNMPGR